MTVGLAVLALNGSAAIADNSASGSASIDPSTSTSSPPAGPTTVATLRAALRAWVKAFLTGSPSDIHSLQGPECRSHTATTASTAFLDQYLRVLRASMRHQLGRPLDQVHITSVDVRNVTARRGEARANYGLPESVVGNDNWVEFTRHGGKWKVSDCKAPILGNPSSSAPAT
jgi:hypothetical protein